MMSLSILGMGWATPLGAGLDDVWDRVLRGERPDAAPAENPFTGSRCWRFEIPAEAMRTASREPRLRRSSVISHLALSAAMDAIRDSSIDPAIVADRMAILFAASNGGVVYTRRFYADLVKGGTHAGSPLLFPETVYNAPASHIAAKFGVTGIVKTIVGDATAALGALKMGEEIINAGEADYVLVVAAEESDWIICEAYATWRLASHTPDTRPLGGEGAIFAEGASAMLLGMGGAIRLAAIHPGSSFARVSEAEKKLAVVLRGIFEPLPPDFVVTSHNGSRMDRHEAAALDLAAPAAPRLHPKMSLGEALTATALAQVIGAALSIRRRPEPCNAGVSVLGLNGHVAGLGLTSRTMGK